MLQLMFLHTKSYNKDTCSTQYKIFNIKNNNENYFECNYFELD
jgi:hypothetical protein